MARPTDTNEALPWGWWLRANGASLEDADGRRWSSVREAYWEGKLGFPSVHFAKEQQELFVRVLAAIDRRGVNVENKHDLFEGDMVFWRFYTCWLFSLGLLAGSARDDVLHASLSDEGQSVLLMLQATREPEWIPLPFAAVVAAVRNGARTTADDDREDALRRFERDVARLPRVFARETVGGRHLVTLTVIGTDARMPVRCVVWSQSFVEPGVRDDLYAWLAERVDRWEDWGRTAYSYGAAALTHHLLGLCATLLRERSEPR